MTVQDIMTQKTNWYGGGLALHKGQSNGESHSFNRASRKLEINKAKQSVNP